MDNRKQFNELMNEHVMGVKIPGILGQGIEFKKIRAQDDKERAMLTAVCQDQNFLMSLPRNEDPEKQLEIQVKPIFLLQAHMHGYLEKYYDVNDPKVQKDLETILRNIPSYLDILIMTTMHLVQLRKLGKTDKNITCRNILALIQFSQNLMQRGWINKDPL